MPVLGVCMRMPLSFINLLTSWRSCPEAPHAVAKRSADSPYSFLRLRKTFRGDAAANNSVCFVVIASGILYSGQRSGPMRAEAQGLGAG
jgi:hypothetical protein